MASNGQSTDQELLLAYTRTRDVDSLGRFMDRYQAPLVRFMGKFLGDADRAQDVVQETFLVVARNPRRLLDVQSCHNWLLRVARNIGIDHLRRDARSRKLKQAFLDRAARDGEARGGETASPIEREEVRERVRAAIDALNPRRRELVLLKVQEDKSYREIAEITGLSVTNVGYLLHMAMKDLSRKLSSSREALL